MTESEIKAGINSHVATPSKWTVGITDSPTRRKGEHGNPGTWYDWKADTETIARSVEKHFLDKDLEGDVGGGVTPIYVYIFMH